MSAADYSGREFNTQFAGLATTVAIMGGVGGACLIGYETLRQMKRLPRRMFVPFWNKDRIAREGVGLNGTLTQEDWEMGHLYHARTFHATTPSPPLARWPLAWAWQALKLDDWFFATHCGMDNVVYVRFLRGMVWWTFLQTLTTAPILLTIDFLYSRGVSTLDMSRASISYLVTYPDPACTDAKRENCPKIPNEQGRKLLWIQLCILWYVTFTWFYTLWWIGKGSLKVRRRLVSHLHIDGNAGTSSKEQRQKAHLQAEALAEERHGRPLREAHGLMLGDPEDHHRGWRQRTLLVTNIPATLRGEGNIRKYFEEYLRPDSGKDIKENPTPGPVQQSVDLPSDILSAREKASAMHLNGRSHEATTPDAGGQALPSPVQNVILVRKMGELSAMLTRRADILEQLEAAHIKLAQAVLRKVSRQQNRKRNARNKVDAEQNASQGLITRLLRRRDRSSESEEDCSDGRGDPTGPHTPLDELASRLAKFCNEDGSLSGHSGNGLLDEKTPTETVWETLSEIPRALLDPYQPITRLSVLFRGQRVPTIDYLLAKLNLLTALIAEMKARKPSDYEPTSTAFVTFRDPRQARMVWRELNTQLVMKVKLAPEVKDIDWDRLMSSSFTGNLVRGFTVNAFFWAFTIFWVIPLSIISTALFSVQRLTSIFPALSNVFAEDPELESFIAVTLPSLLVSLATMTVPEITFQISKRGQGFMTWSALYDRCLCRYWKFLVCNVLIFFCIGVTTVEAILQQIISGPGSNQILNNVAFAFPTAAPFFVSYFILALALHSGFELVGFMVPLIVHFTGANKAATPRARALKTLPRNFNRYYWLPFHTLIMTILFVFTILNPLVIPFGLVYVFFAMIVFKRSFAFVYYRRFMEKEGAVYFIRILRFSCDGLLIAQVVALIFFSVTNQEKAYIALTALLIPITVFAKVLGTQLWKSQCRAIEDQEASAICGIMAQPPHPNAQWQPTVEDIEQGQMYASPHNPPADARASGRYPVVIAPPPTDSRLILTWQRVHDTFHANGADRPSYVAQRAAEGNPVHHPAITGATLLLKAPFHVAKKAQSDGKHIATVAKLSLGVDKTMKAGSVPSGDDDQREGGAVTVEGRVASGKEAIRDGATVERNASVKAGYSEMRRSRSGRSIGCDEPAPFLSGVEALTNHAPVKSEQHWPEEKALQDGEESRMTITSHRSMRGRKTIRSHIFEATDVSRRNQSADVTDSAPAYGERQGGSSQEAEHPLLYPDEKTQQEYRPRSQGEEAEGIAEEQSDFGDDDSNQEELPLVRRHANVSWDDTPDNAARYNNPFYACEIHNFLWLPRDPLLPLNLCDTIEWHGAAFVSSDGGEGVIGEWDEEDDEDEQDDGVSLGGITDTSRLGFIDGNEEIMLNSRLAQRLENDAVEDVEEAVDPAAGLSAKAREDYERALRAERRDSVSDTSQVGRLLSPPPRLQRHSSNISADSHRSPPASVRQRLDAQFNRGQEPLTISTSQVQNLSRVDSLSPISPTQQTSPQRIQSSPGGTQPRTHFAPDPDHTRDHPSQAGPLPPSASLGSMASSAPQRNLSITSDARRRRNISGGASIYSTDTQNRSISMQKALQAEVLEEERRRTIKERVILRAKSKKGGSTRRGSGSRRGRVGRSEGGGGGEGSSPPRVGAATVREEEEGRGEDEGEEADLTYNSTILRRHSRAVGRRLRSSSVMSHGSSSGDPQRSPSMLRGGSRNATLTSSPLPAPAGGILTSDGGYGFPPSSSSPRGVSPEDERQPSTPSKVLRERVEEVEMSDLSTRGGRPRSEAA